MKKWMFYSGHEQRRNVLDNRELENRDKISLRESFISR